MTASEWAPLPPGHPFLAFGECLGFAVASGASFVRLAAAIDRRQLEDGRPVGAVGFVEVSGEVSGTADGSEERRARLFAMAMASAADWLAARGVGVVRCPVQLSTWYGHRAVVDGFTDEGGEPPFFLEPRNGRWLPEALVMSGFGPAVRSVSRLVPSDRASAATKPALTEARAAGYSDRPFRLEASASELLLLHRLSSAIFERAWSFSTISVDEFVGLYTPLLPIVDPDLVRILLDPADDPVGFVFALPDRLGPAAGRSGARFVLKTIGVLPAARRGHPGLGSALVARTHGLALELGYESGIHAQMAVGSYAERASARWGDVIRRYATFERQP